MSDITYIRRVTNEGAERWWEARREGQAAPVGYGDTEREALEALLRAEHKATT